ncbi:MAG: PrsW family intramembrane metalloprotease [Corynebacterium sp.]|nr:PrsW family intramembrane metalloprotease [Corynebacterium sp.]
MKPKKFNLVLLFLWIFAIFAAIANGAFHLVISIIVNPEVSLGLNGLILILWIALTFLLIRFTPLRKMCPPRALNWAPLAFLLGGGGVMLPIYFTEDFGTIANFLHWPATSMSWGGAYPEEILKLLGALVLGFAIPQVRRPWQFAMIAFVIGLGFECVENFQYGIFGGIMDPISDADGLIQTWIIRTIVGPWIHCILAAMSTYFVSMAILRADFSASRRTLTAFAGWFWSFFLHFLYNYSPNNTEPHYITFGVALVLMIISFILVMRHAYKGYKADEEARTNWQFC